MSNNNKNDDMHMLLSDRFNSLDNYLYDCIHRKKMANPIRVRRDVDTIKKIINILSNSNSLEYDIKNLNKIVADLEVCNNTYKKINHNNSKITNDINKIVDKQNYHITNILNVVDILRNIFDILRNPIKVALQMKATDKKSVNNPNFKGLTDDKLQELLDLGYTVKDILIYTSDPNNNCGNYSRSAIYTRINKLKNKT